MNAPTPLPVLLDHLKWNLDHLAEVLKNQKTDYFRNAALQRFGFAVEGAVKCIQSAATQKDVSCDSLRSSLEFVHKQGWLKGAIAWQEIESTYQAIKSKEKENLADTLYDKLPSIHLEFETLHACLKDYTQSPSQ